jgi:hypothetical protein
MEGVSPERVAELVGQTPWKQGEVLRVFWVKVTSNGRESFSRELGRQLQSGERIVGIPVRDACFTNANELLSDMSRIFSKAEAEICSIDRSVTHVTIVVLVKDDLRLAQISSPIVLPTWFPVRPGAETHFSVMDLFGKAEVALLNCPELRIEHVAQLTYDLEKSLVAKLERSLATSPNLVSDFFRALVFNVSFSNQSRIIGYKQHITGIVDARAYRPNAAQTTVSVTTDLIKMILQSSSRQLVDKIKKIGDAQSLIGAPKLKPSFLGVSLRPKAVLSDSQANWHSVSVGLFQAYQMMNAAAHAGDYGGYPVALLSYSSQDLRQFLQNARTLVDLS